MERGGRSPTCDGPRTPYKEVFWGLGSIGANGQEIWLGDSDFGCINIIFSHTGAAIPMIKRFRREEFTLSVAWWNRGYVSGGNSKRVFLWYTLIGGLVWTFGVTLLWAQQAGPPPTPPAGAAANQQAGGLGTEIAQPGIPPGQVPPAGPAAAGAQDAQSTGQGSTQATGGVALPPGEVSQPGEGVVPGGVSAPAPSPPQGPPLPLVEQQPVVKYVEIRPPEGKDERYYVQLRGREILGLLSAGSVPADKEALFREYYEQYAFARWTWPENFGKLAEYRRELRNELLTARGKPIHPQLRQLAFEVLKRYALDEGGPYHPATRVAAVLAISDLNATESVNPREQPVVPLPEAAEFLVNLLKRDDLPDGVAVAVLVGLRRHAVLGIENSQLVETELVPRLVAIGANKVPPAGRSLAGHQWIRARAVEILGILGSPGNNGAISELLTGILRASDEGLAVRRAAARALGLLDYAGWTEPSPAEVIYALGKFVADACEAELKQLEVEIQAGDLPTTRGGTLTPGMGPYGYGPESYMPEYEGEGMYGGATMYAPGMPGAPGMGPSRSQQTVTEDRTLRNRRRLKAILNDAFFAVTSVDEPMWVPSNRPMDGIASLIPQDNPHREAFQRFFERLQALLALCDTKDLDRTTLRDRIRAEFDRLQEWLLSAQTTIQAAATTPAKPET